VSVKKSIRQRILEAFKARLEAIHGQGFQTNAGHRVYLGVDAELSADEDLHSAEHDTAAIQISVGDDEPDHQMEHVQVKMPVVISAVSLATYREPWTAIEATLGDIKRAVELEDRTLGGLVPEEIERGVTSTRPREAGSEVVGLEITYDVLYTEAWGQPAER
jgi:hypothetical protein